MRHRNAEKIGGIEIQKDHGDWAGIYYRDELIGLLDSKAGKPVILGVAADIGTTGLSVCLLDLCSGGFLGTLSRLNPQCHYGGDVVTRVSYCCDRENGLEFLHDLVLNEISSMINELLNSAGFKKDDIYRVAVAGNTVMLHIFAGVSPYSIARYPYRPVFTEPLDLRGQNKTLPVNPSGIVTLLPSIAGYIGGDITAGLAAINFPDREGASLFIDIGTNGEMVLAKSGHFFAASTAAGPALEGMNIDCGSRAVPGAIEKFYMRDGKMSYEVIGDSFFAPAPAPSGICGSGLIDLIACLLQAGIINDTGRLDISRDKVRDNKYFIDGNIFISQKDIRQVQLAKAAIASGIQLLLKSSGTDYSELEKIYIAGSFGYHLNFSNLQKIGMISGSYKGDIEFAGNTSLAGASKFLRDREILRRMQNWGNMVVVELAQTPEFQEVFVDNINFPTLKNKQH